MKHRSWPLIAIAFTALLTVVGISAYDVARQTRHLRDSILTTEAQAQQRDKILRDVRDNSAALAIAVRDSLLDPSGIGAPARVQLNELHQSLLAGIGRLQNPQDASQSELARQLSALHEQYWQMAMVSLGWSAQERRSKGVLFLRQKLAPLRNSAMASATSIEHIEERLLREHHARLEESLVRLDDALTGTLATTLLIGLLITALTVWRVSHLEARAAHLQRQTDLDRDQLRDLSQRLVHAHEDERKSLARELHDQIGQMLTAIQMVFTNIELGRGDPMQQVEDGKSLTQLTVAAARSISMGLRPSILDDLGLGPAIEWQTREFTKRCGILVHLQMDGHLESLSEAETICFYRVVQEALTNCARHAKASGVRINLHVGRDTISLTVEDNGQGFDLGDLPRRGLGLFGIQERVRELGGTASIFAQPGKGTLVRIEVPSRTEGQA